MPTSEEFVQQVLYNMSKVSYALKYLSTIPQTQPILRNIPYELAYEFSADMLTPARYSAVENKVTLNPIYMDLKTPLMRLNFLITLAHELCHATQKNEGLVYDTVKGPTFGSTFRVFKMMEIETRLMEAQLENELLKRPEFSTCKPSPDCVCYRLKLQKAQQDVSKANSDFVVTYWRNGVGDKDLSFDLRQHINYVFMFYTEQAYRLAYETHSPAFGMVPTDLRTPEQIMARYLARMNITDLKPQLFLTNKVDHVVTTRDFRHGITVLNLDGSVFANLRPTTNPRYDKLTYYANNKPREAFLRDTVEKTNTPWKSRNSKKNVVTHMTIARHNDPQPNVDPSIHKKD